MHVLPLLCICFSFWALAIAQLPFTFSPAFTASLNLLGTPAPIAIPGGTSVVLPINGTISGPLLSGKILGGFAHPSIYYNQTVEQNDIDAYGMTYSNSSFYFHVAGAGSPVGQVTRVEVTIGGSQYSSLTNGFILGSTSTNANRTVVTLDTYLVTL
ncbi:hypothetical protein AAFC00_005628 [Neodothiora populina]|uniref:Uncharacterized protein n=1 Tax=Neodothiora populina TaxID=2781224 RepID=A0ABR3PLU2_9PEZI